MNYVNFLFNKLSNKKIILKAKEFYKTFGLQDILKLAYYLLIKRVCIEPNFHRTYNKFIENISCHFPKFSRIIFTCTTETMFLILNKNLKCISSSEVKMIKYLGSWIARLIFRLNKIFLNNFLVIEKLLLKAYDINILVIFIPFMFGLLHFISKLKFFCLDSIWIQRLFSLLYEIINLLFLKKSLKIDIKSLFNFLGINKKLFLNINENFKKKKTCIFQTDFKQEIFFINISKCKNYNTVFLKSKLFFMSNISNEIDYSESDFCKNFDNRSLLSGELPEKIYILIGLFKKIYLFSKKIFSLRIRNIYTLELFILNNKFDFWRKEGKFLQFIFSSHIKFSYSVYFMLFNYFQRDDVKFSSNFIWLTKNKRYILNLFSFIYEKIQKIKKKMLNIFIHERIEYYLSNINLYKREKFIKDNRIKNNFQNRFVKIHEEIFISKIFFFNFDIIIHNKIKFYKNIENLDFFIYCKIFERELFYLLIIKMNCINLIVNYISKQKIFICYSKKIKLLKLLSN